MFECINKKIIINNRVEPCNKFNANYLLQGKSLYEVIRIMDGIPLFIEDHFERLANSAIISEQKIPVKVTDLQKNIHQLIEQNHINSGNCIYVLNYPDKISYHTLCYSIKHSYPTDEEYRNGIKTVLFHAERQNPNAKALLYELRLRIDMEKERKKLKEVLLVDENNCITEGSRSNVFFIKGDLVVSPPAKKILPLCQINSNKFSVKHPLLQKIKKEYDLKIKGYLEITNPQSDRTQ